MIDPKTPITIILTGLYGENYHPDAGGIQVAERAFSEFASKNGQDITVVSGKNSDRNESEHSAKVIDFQTPQGLGGGVVDSWPFAFNAGSVAATKAVENGIIHFTSLFPAVAFLLNPIFPYLVNAQKYHSKFFYTLHNYHYAIADQPEDIFALYPKEWQVLHNAERNIIGIVDKVAVPCHNYVSILSNKFGRRVEYLPNTIGERNEYFVKHQFHTKYTILLTMCRLAKEKNLDTLISAFCLAYRANNKLRLLIAGSGDQEHNLKDFVLKNGLKYYQKIDGETVRKAVNKLNSCQILFTGQINKQDKKTALNMADMFILLSKREVCPLVGLENMAYGNPIIASNIPGWQDYKDRNAAINLVNINNIEEIVNEMLQLSEISRIKRQDIEKANFAAYDNYYSPQVVMAQRMNFYQQIK